MPASLSVVEESLATQQPSVVIRPFTHVVNRFTDSQPHLIVSRATAAA
jgi:hypothetical protein